ncbi:methyl-accepting chemotaxis protein [Pseudomonas sp. LJDD11]|nr:methyl-accepting chemotaxis protein [Pseudomonas sp. LJDD11]MCQ9425768.1 methyl-accepting chemotaxis protein [Pseudomonas sp. LJDD11]
MYRWLANLTVARKLMTGFGLLLLMSVLIFCAGWSSISALSGRMDRMSAVNTLMDDLATMRLARSDYLQSEGNAEKAGTLEKRISATGQTLNALAGLYRQASNQAILAEMAHYLTQYSAGLNNLKASYQQIDDSRAMRRSTGDKTLALLDSLDGYIGKNQLNAEQQYTLYRAVKDLQMQFLYARFETRAYTYSNNPNSFSASVAAVDKTLSSLEVLRQSLDDSGQSVASSLHDLVLGYRATLDVHQAALVQIRTQVDEIKKQGDAMLQLSQGLYASQMQLRTQDTQTAAWTMALSLALALGLGVFGAVLITRQIAPPLRAALQSVRRIASGDLTVQPASRREDEIGQLEQGLADMVTHLRQLISHIGDGASMIASSTQQLSAITRQTSSGASEQKLETEQVATAMHQMSTSVQDVARSAVETASAVDQAAQDANGGATIVTKAIEQIENLTGEVQLTSQAVSSLALESGRIGAMLDVIKSVAEQTNLLALNAAIEAARAGEAGRGFAVVADEVRALAQRTQQSTQEIEALIAALQQGTQRAVQRMDASLKLTTDSVGLARDAGQALSSITSNIIAIQGMTRQIAAAAEQQGAVAQEISRSVVNVRSITEQAYTASEQTSQASMELARLGHTLQGHVQRFQV